MSSLNNSVFDLDAGAPSIFDRGPSAAACPYGLRFAIAQDSTRISRDVFVPADDVGLEGNAHAEVLADEEFEL